MVDFRDMTDVELWERYLNLKGALKEYGHVEMDGNPSNVLEEYMHCTTEISCRYFEEKGIYNRKAREELLKGVILNGN